MPGARAYRGGLSAGQWSDIARASRLASRHGVKIALYGDRLGFTGCTVCAAAAGSEPQPAAAAAPAPAPVRRTPQQLRSAVAAGEILHGKEKARLRSADRAAEHQAQEATAAAASALPPAASPPAEPAADAAGSSTQDTPIDEAPTSGVKRAAGGPSPVKAPAPASEQAAAPAGKRATRALAMTSS